MQPVSPKNDHQYKKLRILFLTKRQYTNKDLIDDRYGRMRELPLELGRLGYEVRGLCLSYQNKPETCIEDEGVQWINCNATGFKLPGLIKYMIKTIKMAENADIIIAGSDSIFGIIGFFAARIHEIPLIFDLYDNFDFFLLARLPIIKQLYGFVIRHCEAVTCVSNPLARLVATKRKRPGITVIENATDLSLFKPMDQKMCRYLLGLPEEGTFIGTAGAIHINRGFETLFKAFDRLKKEMPRLRLILAGNWDRSIPKKNHPNIHYLGELPLQQVPLLINSLDVAVICNTDNEFGRYCFPQKAYEILACKTPLAVADVGSMSEMFKDDPHHLFKPHDVDTLIQCIRYNLKGKEIPHLEPLTWKDTSKTMSQVIQKVSSK